MHSEEAAGWATAAGRKAVRQTKGSRRKESKGCKAAFDKEPERYLGNKVWARTARLGTSKVRVRGGGAISQFCKASTANFQLCETGTDQRQAFMRKLAGGISFAHRISAEGKGLQAVAKKAELGHLPLATSSVSVVTNAIRLRRFNPPVESQLGAIAGGGREAGTVVSEKEVAHRIS